MSQSESAALFDRWAGTYDRSVQDSGGFPFDGYDRVLDAAVRLAEAAPGSTVLDLGTGTGSLAARFVSLGCAVVGTDFSAEMLAQARVRLPQAQLVQADLMGPWPAELDRRFDRIASAYVLHEFDLPRKMALLRRLAADHLEPGGKIVIADIAFPTAAAREEAHRRWADRWDEDEYYWAADEVIAPCRDAGLQAVYMQISGCGGVFTFRAYPKTPQSSEAATAPGTQVPS